MGKIVDLQKRRKRVEKELEKATVAYAKQAELIKTKTVMLEQIDMDIVSQLLVDQGMNMNDLMTMLGSTTVEESAKTNDIKEAVEITQSHLGGDTDEI